MKQRPWAEFLEPQDVRPLYTFLRRLGKGERKYLLQNDIVVAFEAFARDAAPPSRHPSLDGFVRRIQEVIYLNDHCVLIHRHRLGRDRIFRIALRSKGLPAPEEITVAEFLDLRDRFVLGDGALEGSRLRIDFLPFYDYSPLIRDPRNVGKGISFLNRHMSSSLFQNPEKWNRSLFEFLRIHCLGGRQLLVDPRAIPTQEVLLERLERAVDWLEQVPARAPLDTLTERLHALGFADGWGDGRDRIHETMQLLLDLYEAPDSQTLERFIARIPMVSKVVVVSPHGFFGQENVLGRPDTGGQVVYILDQVRALEGYLAQNLRQSGLEFLPQIVVLTRRIPESEGTTCHVPREAIRGTRNGWIVRVPFRDKEGNEIPHWISRFWIWPHLERFAYEAKEVLLRELGRKPDLIIGNYSDGNLVASILSEETGVIQCNIAHALEKSKYLFSDLYWRDMEDEYHFSLQFTADLLSMNMADFIITSTFQEIAGTPYVRGQYESYHYYSMPGLCQVVGGINLFHPKFNVISPGVDQEVYFPYHETGRRDPARTRSALALLSGPEDETVFGTLADPKKPPIFTISRLDRIKNVAGLVACYGRAPELQEAYNLVLVAGKVAPEQTDDPEERGEIHKIHELIREHGLAGRIRWIGRQLPREEAGELYRVVADLRGVFVQPALFEAFGLTVIEAMACGLPVFATQFGGPSEIIRHGVDGFLINPTRPDQVRELLACFHRDRCERPLGWDHVSQNAVRRVQERFTWQHYSEQLLKLTKLYGFWRYAVSEKGKRKMKLYAETLYHLLFKRRAEEI